MCNQIRLGQETFACTLAVKTSHSQVPNDLLRSEVVLAPRSGVKVTSSQSNLLVAVFTGAAMLAFVSGCAEGYFWKTGKYAPWVRQQWEAEEQIANTLFARKKAMTDAVSAASNASVEQQEAVAKQLSEVILRDPVLLIRLHALKLITVLDCPQTKETLTIARTDPSSDIRTATVKSLKNLPAEFSVFQLQEIIANDTDDDVRIAATKALGDFSGTASVKALSLALQDRNPALQVSATESLMKVTGQSEFGRDVNAWQKYVQQVAPGSVNENGSPLDRTLTADPGVMDQTYR